MTRIEHLLFILAEECAEVAQVASKAARFGPDSNDRGRLSHTNAELLRAEFNDICAVMGMLEEAGCAPLLPLEEFRAALAAKRAKVERFLGYSADCGTLAATPDQPTSERSEP